MEYLTYIAIALGLFIFQRYFLRIRRKDGTQIWPRPETKEAAPAPSLHWPSQKGQFDFEIVGESHYQDALRQLCGDHGEDSPQKECRALLFPETNNRHDSNAVRVEIEGRTVGYLSRDDAPRFRKRLTGRKLKGAATTCDAIIVGGYRMDNGERAHYGVKLDIKPFD